MRNLNNNALFRLLDRIPLFRRSGTASRSDLAKALGITLALCMLVNIPMFMAHPELILVSLAVTLPVVLGALLFHPFLSHRASFGDNATSLFRKRSTKPGSPKNP